MYESRCKDVDDRPNYLLVAAVVGVICLVSAVVHEHKDKARFQEVRLMRLLRFDIFLDKKYVGR